MTAAALVADLQARGVTLTPDGDILRVKPVSLLTPYELETLRARKPEVLALLTSPVAGPPPGPDPGDVARRAALFRHQVEQSTGGPLPLLTLSGVDSQAGECLSCGVPLTPDRAHRCATCAEAVYVALGIREP